MVCVMLHYCQATYPLSLFQLELLPFSFEGASDYKSAVDIETLDTVEEAFCEEQSHFGCKKEFVDVFLLLLEENNLANPKTASEAENLYLTLLILLQGVV